MVALVLHGQQMMDGRKAIHNAIIDALFAREDLRAKDEAFGLAYFRSAPSGRL